MQISIPCYHDYKSLFIYVMVKIIYLRMVTNCTITALIGAVDHHIFISLCRNYSIFARIWLTSCSLVYGINLAES